jgi:signal transduction histidine kinase
LKFFGRRTPVERADRLATADPGASVHDEVAGFSEPVMVLDLGGAIVAANAAARALDGFPTTPLDGSTEVEPLLSEIRLTNGGGSPPWVPVPGHIGLDAFVSASEWSADQRIYELDSVPREDADGRTTGWIVRLSDQTPLIAALRGQAAASGHRDRLLKLMSHDLRSPLAAILATLSHPDLNTMPDTLRRVIETGARRTLHMIDSNVRSIRAETADYRFAPLDLSHIVEEVIDASWSQSKAAGVKLALEPPSEDFFVLADRGYLTEAITDLFRHLLNSGGAGRVLRCDFRPSTLGGIAAVTLSIRDGAEDALNRGRPDMSADRIAPARSAFDVAEDDSRIMFFNVVVKRHSGTATLEGEPGVDQIASITIPLTDPILHS